MTTTIVVMIKCPMLLPPISVQQRRMGKRRRKRKRAAVRAVKGPKLRAEAGARAEARVRARARAGAGAKAAEEDFTVKTEHCNKQNQTDTNDIYNTKTNCTKKEREREKRTT